MGTGDVVPLFGAYQTQQGQRVGGGIARQVRRESEAIAANVELAAVREQGQAFLAAQALSNVSTLVQIAEANMRVARGSVSAAGDRVGAAAHRGAASRCRFRGDRVVEMVAKSSLVTSVAGPAVRCCEMVKDH